MKVRYIFKSLLIVILLAVAVTGCDYDKELLNELPVTREFAPVGLTALVRNQVNVELNWSVDNNVEYYVVEFSDDAEFNNIVKTVEVLATELPVQIPLDGETLYSIRVKAVSARGIGDSTWATTTVQTLTEQIFLTGDPSDIRATEVTLRWAPASTVTAIRLNPGDITRTITDQEKADGVAIITGLTPETAYTATLLNGTRVRGVRTFTTGIDIGAGILVTPEDDLLQMIADASSGDILVLEPGDYTEQTGTITLDKSITIRGLRSFDKPKLNVNFKLIAGATDVSLIDLDIKGNGQGTSTLSDFLEYTAAGNYNSLLISGSNIHDYPRTFVRNNVTGAILQNFTVENSIVYNIFTLEGDFIDFRTGDVLNLNLNTSTFYNCAIGRDFIRMDNVGAAENAGNTANIIIDRVTIYGCATGTSNRILYVRFRTNNITVKNTIIAQSQGMYSNQSLTDSSIEFSRNNYFNAPKYFDSTVARHDNSDTYFTLDPGFASPSTGDFTISNQTLIDNNVGDPRWRP